MYLSSMFHKINFAVRETCVHLSTHTAISHKRNFNFTVRVQSTKKIIYYPLENVVLFSNRFFL